MGSGAKMSEIDAEHAATPQETLVFQSDDDDRPVLVRLESEDVWITQAQMASIFSIQPGTVADHLSKIYASGELDRGDSLRRIRIERAEGGRRVERELNHYNLDAVLAVGYRVSSARGARFRRWATKVLRQRLENEMARRRGAESARLLELQEAFSLAKAALENAAEREQTVLSDEARAVLDVVERYARSFTLLLQYDEDRLPEAKPAAGGDGDQPSMAPLPVADARAAIRQLKSKLHERGEDNALFGQERGDGLEAVLGNIEQTFFGEALYPTVAARAANLLYFIVKDHPFSDGNKRIGSFLFLEYLRRNGALELPDGRMRIEDNALVALALLIAESDPAQRELVVRLTLGLLGDV